MFNLSLTIFKSDLCHKPYSYKVLKTYLLDRKSDNIFHHNEERGTFVNVCVSILKYLLDSLCLFSTTRWKIQVLCCGEKRRISFLAFPRRWRREWSQFSYELSGSQSPVQLNVSVHGSCPFFSQMKSFYSILTSAWMLFPKLNNWCFPGWKCFYESSKY